MTDYYEQTFKLYWDPNVERLGLGTLVKKVNHIAIVVSDVNKSLAFYVQVLGLQQIRKPNFDRHGAWLSLENVELHLIKGIPTVAKDDHLNVPHISVESDDIEAVLQKLTEMKVPFSENVSVSDASEIKPITQYFIRDPDGYYIELCDCNKLTKFCLGIDEHGIQYNELVEKVPLSLVFKLAQFAISKKTEDEMQIKVIIPPKNQWLAKPDAIKLKNMLGRCQIYGDLMQNETEESIGLALRQANNHVPLATKIICENKLGKETFISPAFYKQGQEKYQPKHFIFVDPENEQKIQNRENGQYDIMNNVNILGTDEQKKRSYLSIAQKTFDLFDKVNSRTLSLQKLSKVFASLHIKFDETILSQKFSSMDANCDSVVSFEEFVELMNHIPSVDDNQQWNAFFSMLDLDGNGKITCPELGVVLREMNIEMKDRNLENLFIEMDDDGNGFLSIEEIRQYFIN